MNSISQQGQRFVYDALVIGGGIAGLHMLYLREY